MALTPPFGQIIQEDQLSRSLVTMPELLLAETAGGDSSCTHVQNPRAMKVSKTRNGLRLSQHGVVISEMRLRPGPTHSLFDVLASLVTVLCPQGRVGLLGFAGGGMMAPLRALGWNLPLDAVDLDADAFRLFQRHCRSWSGTIHWHHREASEWLRAQPKRSFDLIVEDLSVPDGGDVFKPAVSWETLPGLIRQRLKPDGVAIFNLIKPRNGRWNPGLSTVASQFAKHRYIHLEQFENVLLVAGNNLPPAARIGYQVREQLSSIGSQQARKIRVASVHRALTR